MNISDVINGRREFIWFVLRIIWRGIAVGCCFIVSCARCLPLTGSFVYFHFQIAHFTRLIDWEKLQKFTDIHKPVWAAPLGTFYSVEWEWKRDGRRYIKNSATTLHCSILSRMNLHAVVLLDVGFWHIAMHLRIEKYRTMQSLCCACHLWDNEFSCFQLWIVVVHTQDTCTVYCVLTGHR